MATARSTHCPLRMPGSRRWGPAAALILLALALTHLPETVMAAPQPAEARVGVPVANVRSGPGTGYPVVTRYVEGMPVRILEESGSWWRIQLPRQGPGWIFKKLVLCRPATRQREDGNP